MSSFGGIVGKPFLSDHSENRRITGSGLNSKDIEESMMTSLTNRDAVWGAISTLEPHVIRLMRLFHGEFIVEREFHGICTTWFVLFTMQYDVVHVIYATVQHDTVPEFHGMAFFSVTETMMFKARKWYQ